MEDRRKSDRRSLLTSSSSRRKRSHGNKDENYDMELYQENHRSKKYYMQAKEYVSRGNYRKAIKCLNISESLCKDEEFLSKIYARRGYIYSILEKPACSFQAFLDYERSLQLDTRNMEAQIYMSKVFFKAAHKLFLEEKYSRSIENCRQALDLYRENRKAGMLLKLAESKLSDESLNKESRASASKKRSPVKTLDAKSGHYKATEIKLFYRLISVALKSKNYPRAVIHMNKALPLLKDINAWKKYHDLLELKQKIMKLMPRTS